MMSSRMLLLVFSVKARTHGVPKPGMNAPHCVGTAMVLLVLPRSRCRYSNFAVQFPNSRVSIPAPAAQPNRIVKVRRESGNKFGKSGIRLTDPAPGSAAGNIKQIAVVGPANARARGRKPIERLRNAEHGHLAIALKETGHDK